MRRRRNITRKPAKTQHGSTTKPKRNEAPTAAREGSSTLADLQQQVSALARELSEAREQQTVTADVLKVFNRSTFDLDAVLETIIENATRLGGAEQGFIYRSDGEVLHLVADHGTSPEFKAFRKKNPPRPGDGSIIGRTALTRRIVHIPDIFDDAEYKFAAVQKLGGFRSLLSVPMLRGDGLLGVIHMWRTQAKPFTSNQIELVTSFADQAVIAIENVRTFEDSQRQTRELSNALDHQTATLEVLSLISSSQGKLGHVFETILSNTIRICEAEFGTMYQREGEAFRLVAMHGVPNAYADQRAREALFRPPAGGGLDRVVQTMREVRIADITEDKAYPQNSAMVKLAGARSTLTIPMIQENELIGAVTIYRTEVRPFTDKQVEWATSFARQAAVALENVRLLNELRERTDDLSQSVEELSALGEVSQAINSTLDAR